MQALQVWYSILIILLLKNKLYFNTVYLNDIRSLHTNSSKAVCCGKFILVNLASLFEVCLNNFEV